MAARDVFVIGSANTDFIVEVQRRPKPGETVLGSDLVTAPGGKGGNQAVAIARLGGHVALLSRVGADWRGEALRASLRAAGVDSRYVLGTPDVATGSAIVTVTADGENTVVVSPGANAHVERGDVDAAADELRSARCVLVQLELALAVVVHALESAERAGVRAVLNAAPARALVRDVLALVDPLVVNEHEAAVLLEAGVDAERPELAARALLERGARSVVITLGAAGAVAADRSDGYCNVAAPAVRAVDTTGAGDAFTGALALALARGATLAAAVHAGVRAGSFAVQRLGAQSSLPTSSDLDGS